MNPTTHARSRPFGIGTRTEIRLDAHRLLTLSLRAGDLLRSDGGLVWATIDGQADDTLLERGDVYVVARDGEMRVSGFGPARLEVYGNGPLRFEWPRRRPLLAALASAWGAVAAGLGHAGTAARGRGAPAHAA